MGAVCGLPGVALVDARGADDCEPAQHMQRGGALLMKLFSLFTVRIGYKNIPVSIDDAPKAVQGERNVVTTISARSAQRI